MQKKLLYLLPCLLLAFVVFVPRASLATQAAEAPIRLQDTVFVPTRGEAPNIAPNLMAANQAANQRGYYIVQFEGPVQQAWKDAVTAAGGDLLGYIPDYAFKVRMNPAQANRVENLASVGWVGVFQPAYKLSTDLKLDGTNLYRVRAERGVDFGLTRAAVAQTGAELLAYNGDIMLIGATADQINGVAQVADVAWIENYVVAEKHNDTGAGVIVGGNAANANGYDGSTQTAAVADTGIGDGTTTGAHRDIEASRVVSVYNWPGSAQGNQCFQSIIDDGAIDVDSAHGTHVSGSVLSSGDPQTGLGKGTAPAAKLVFQATENYALISNFCQVFGGFPAAGYFLTGLPDDLKTLYQQAYNDGARIHANSWGSNQAGVYTLDSANTDQFIWENPDMTITFSAGNDGQDANSNGVVDNDSIGSPATAKNVITVGASENARPDNFPCDTNLSYTSNDAYQAGLTCGDMNGTNELGTAGSRWGFTTEPLNSDLAAGNAEQMAPFSSRGPTDDGRIKPDIVAPGTWILSTFSDLYQQEYDSQVDPQSGLPQYDGWGMPYNAFYKYMGGTSMSNPIAAGAATVVRDYFNKAHSHDASAALVKASLINSAVDLLDENNDGQDDNDYPIPNVHEGWGRIDVNKATDGSLQWVENTAGLSTGNNTSYQYNITSAGSPFKVTLVWSDYPSTESASSNLVNNLNLVVTSPTGTTYRGNVFSNGWSQAGGSADNVNNVENVYVESAAAGTWTVQIVGQNIPQGPQPFAIVVDGIFGAVDAKPTVNITAPADGATVAGTVSITADASDDDAVSQVEFFADGVSIGVDTTAPYAVSWDSSSVADGSVALSAIATDSASQTSNADSVNVTVDNVPSHDPPTVSITSPSNGATVSGSVTIAAAASDDNGVTQVEFFVDGSSIGVDTTAPYEASWDSTAVADGNYTISATATDTASQTSSDSISVTTDNQADPTMHVGDIDAVTSSAKGGKWNAEFTVTIHDSSENPVANASVTGSLSNGASGSGTCTTNANGQCTLVANNISKRSNSVTFTVTNVTHASNTYDSSANHDPDGDSNGTSMTVAKP